MFKKFSLMAKCFNVQLTEQMYMNFQIYMQTLIEWNKKINLTTITKPNEIIEKHFLDSLSLCKYINFRDNMKIIDIGTGAGFPGVPLKIAFSNLDLSLMDSQKKRLLFLDDLLKKLNLHANLVHSRAEEASRKAQFRESFDIASARAVARLKILAEYCLPYVKIGGIFAAMKQENSVEEINDAVDIIDKLGAQIDSINSVTLPSGSKREIILIKKINHTPSQFPRRMASIARA
jgi:16S rRNA (guanine(527)-N(7))-methyltransferase RsmG